MVKMFEKGSYNERNHHGSPGFLVTSWDRDYGVFFHTICLCEKADEVPYIQGTRKVEPYVCRWFDTYQDGR